MDRSRAIRWIGPALVVLAGAGAAAAIVATGDDSQRPTSTTALDPAPVAVSADTTRYARIEELAAASDLIVRAHVAEVARGRTVGVDGVDPAASAIVIREVTLAVDEVLGGRRAAATGVAPGDTVQVEEEGWLGDGNPLVVNGLAPSEVGDDSLWFLTQVSEHPGPTFISVNEQGRFIASDGILSGASGDDALVASIESMTPDELTARLRAIAAAGP